MNADMAPKMKMFALRAASNALPSKAALANKIHGREATWIFVKVSRMQSLSVLLLHPYGMSFVLRSLFMMEDSNLWLMLGMSFTTKTRFGDFTVTMWAYWNLRNDYLF